jgi:hypothetical protein
MLRGRGFRRSHYRLGVPTGTVFVSLEAASEGRTTTFVDFPEIAAAEEKSMLPTLVRSIKHIPGILHTKVGGLTITATDHRAAHPHHHTRAPVPQPSAGVPPEI